MPEGVGGVGGGWGRVMDEGDGQTIIFRSKKGRKINTFAFGFVFRLLF